MALKDWKKGKDKNKDFGGWSEKESKGKYVVEYHKKGKSYDDIISIFPQKTTKAINNNSGYDIHQVRIHTFNEEKREYNPMEIKHFKSKSQALSYARTYMRSH